MQGSFPMHNHKPRLYRCDEGLERMTYIYSSYAELPVAWPLTVPFFKGTAQVVQGTPLPVSPANREHEKRGVTA